MTIWYVDPVGGNDANAGNSFATRVRTFAGASAKAVAAGDSVRVIKSADAFAVSGQSTTSWVDGSKNVTLASAVTQNISLSTAAWTANGANVTTTTSTNRKIGATSASIAVAAAFTTGLAAYFPTGTLDLSGYQQVSFWIRMTAGTMSADADISLALCSDTAGATVVNTINIPWIKFTGVWQCITVDTGAALGSNIQSVALYINQDRAAQTFLINNILACKASSASDSITLSSLISPDNTATSAWWVIDSINGTTLSLAQSPNEDLSTLIQLQGYSNAAGNQTGLYKREPIVYGSAIIESSQSANTNGTFSKSGTISSYITISGGWNSTDMSTQTGDSYLSTYSLSSTGLYVSGNFVNIASGLNFSRFYAAVAPSNSSSSEGATYVINNISGCVSGINLGAAGGYLVSFNVNNIIQCSTGIAISPILEGATLTLGNISGNTSGAILGGYPSILTPSGSNKTIVNIGTVRRNGGVNGGNSSGTGLQIQSFSNSIITISNASFNVITNLNITGGCDNKIFFNNTTASSLTPYSASWNCITFNEGHNNTVYLVDKTTQANLVIAGGLSAINTVGNGVNTVIGGIISGATAAAMIGGNGKLYLQNTSVGSGTAWTPGPLNYTWAHPSPTLYWQAYNNVATDNRIYYNSSLVGQITTDTTTRHTASGVSWKMTTAASVDSLSPTAVMPLSLPIGQVAVSAGTAVTASVWIYVTSTSATVKLHCDYGTTAGIAAWGSSDTTASFSANTWTQVSLITTPTNAGVYSYSVQVYGTTGVVSCYVDDFSVSQA